MKITRNFEYEKRGLAILDCRGEFDTFYCPGFQEEVEALGEREGIIGVGYKLQYVRWINSTAIGAMIKGHKRLTGKGINSYLLTPTSDFVDTAIRTLGVDQVIPMKPLEEVLQALDGLRVR